MQLTHEQINDFIKIHQKQTCEILSVEEAREAGMRVINFMRAVYRPIRKADYAEIAK